MKNDKEIAVSAYTLGGFSRVRGISDTLFNVKFDDFGPRNSAWKTGMEK